MLHQPGIDHQRLIDKFQDLNFKLTGVEESRVLREILAWTTAPPAEQFQCLLTAPFSAIENH